MDEPDDDRLRDAAVTEESHSAVAVLRTPALRRVLIAFFIFGTSEWATVIAIMVWAFAKGGPSAAGLVTLVQMVPAAIAAPFAASLGDRMRRDRALALGYGLQCCMQLIVAVALVLDAPVPVVYLTAAMAMTSIVLTRPVHHAIIPEIAETPAEITVGHSATSSIEGLSMFVGPVVTGILVGLYGSALVFFITAVGALISVLLTFSLPLKREFQRDLEVETVVKATFTGLHDLRHNTGAILLTAFVGAQWVVIGALDVLTVVFGIDVLKMGEEGPGILMSAVGVGGLIGAAATVILIGRRTLSPAIAGGVLATGVSITAVGFSTIPTLAWLLLAISGLGKAFADVAGRTLLHRAVPHQILARIFGVQESMMMAGVAVGAVVTPILVNHLGAAQAFIATGIFLPVFGLLALTQIRKLDASAELPGPGFARLESIPMFAALSQVMLEQLSRHLTSITVPAGTDIFEQGDAGDLLYIVDQGTVDIIRHGVQINDCSPGDYFGEIALLQDVPRTATAHASEEVHLFALARDEFLEAVTGTSKSHSLAHAEANRRREHDEPD
jgi:MFS family permease